MLAVKNISKTLLKTEKIYLIILFSIDANFILVFVPNLQWIYYAITGWFFYLYW